MRATEKSGYGENLRNFGVDCCVFLLMFFSSAFQLSVYSGTVRMVFYLFLAVILLVLMFFSRTPIKINIWVALAVALGMMTSIVNLESAKQLVIFLSYYVVAILFCSYIPVEKFFHSFVRVLAFVSAVSLILYVLDVVYPSMLSYLPTVQNEGGLSTESAIVALAPIDGRNYGMFWEPGAYQIFLCFALILEMFYFKARHKLSFLLIMVALITTFSTMGYLVLAVLILVSFLSLGLDRGLRKSYVYALFSLVFAIVLAYFVISYVSPQLYHTLFGKVEEYFLSPDETSSTGVRVSSVAMALKVAIQNPLFGAGYEKLYTIFENEYSHTMTTCTWANWLAIYGLAFGALMVVGLHRLCKKISSKGAIAAMLVFVLLLSISSEDMARNPSWIVLIIYGFNRYSVYMKGGEDRE